ncbi:MAG: hypothetical protein OEZ58_14750, partial [Gammaproteobacteria bacterium]|nr:hypothetical protein [Gammaproteobacteria bacterium]
IATVHHADAVVVDSAVSINAQVVSASAHDRTTSFVYDSKDQLVEKLDAEGYLTHYQYDALGNRTTLVRFEDASDLVDLTKQQVMRYQYDDMNRMTHVTNAAGITAESIYDQFGNKIRVTHGANTEASRTTYFAYDDMNRQIETRNAAGIITRFEYDSENQRRLVYEAWDQPEQRISQTVYDENGQVRQLIFADGTSKHFQYDAAGNRTVIIDANGHETRYVYDSKNQLSQIVAADGSVTRYEYDAYGNAVQVIDALGQTTTQYFNKLNQLSVLVNADGSVVKYEYDAFGNRISETRFANRLAAEVDPNTLPTVIASENDQTRFFVFDHTGNLVRSVDSLGHVVEYQYDEMGNQTQIHAYANSVNVTDYAQARDLELTPSALDHLQQFEYDNVGKLSLTTDAEGYSTRYQYDVFGNTTLIESGLYLLDSNDPNYDSSKINLAHPTQVQYSYDELNRLVSMQDSLNVVTNYQYDKLGNRIAIIEGANTDQSRQWSFSYDEMNRMVSKTDPAGIVTQFEYDLAGQQTAIIEAYGLPSQRVTQFSYDELGRLIQQTHADQTITQFQYNGTGQLVQKTDAVGTADQRLTTFNYDAMNRMIEETIAAGSTDALTTIHQYDSFGNRVLTTIAPNTVDALTTTQVFDNRNQMIAQTNGIGATTIYSYDAFGNLIQQSITDRNSGITQATQMQYDGRNLLVSTSDANNVTTLMRYDAAGNLIDQTVAANTSDAVVTAFSYDQANRLVEKVIDPDGLALSTQLAYDVYGNLVSETRGGVTRNTEYDVMNHALVVTDGEGFSTSFAYDVFGNQTSITLGQYLVSPGDANYDANKALLAHETTTRFAYDAMNRQTFMVDSLGVVTKYDYDARGNKIEDTQAYAYLAPTDSVIEANMVRISSVQTEVLFTDARTFRYEYNLRDQIVNTIQPNGTVAHTDYNDAGLQCQKILDHGEGKLNVTTQYFYDASGQVQFIVDPMGHVTHFEYDDFGNLIAETKGLALDGNNQPSTALTTDARTTRYSYDLANRKTAEIIDPNGLAITTQYEYDQRGNSIAIVDANGNRGESAYDKADRLIWQRNGEGDIKTFDYDARSNRIAEHFFAIDGSSLLRGELPTIDAKDKTVRYQFDNNDRLISRTDARGIINTLQYDAVGNLVLNIENANNWNGEAARVRKNEYNHANVVVTQYEHMGLDQAGEPVFIDGVTVKTDYEYDAVYNLIEKNVLNTWYNTLVEPATRVEQVQTTQFKYDLNNRITERAIDPNGLNIRTGYRYDALGNTVAEISANGFAVSGHLTGSARDSLLAQYTTYTFYDAASRAIYQVEPHGFVQESQYDAVGNQVKTIQYAHAINVLSIADGNLPNVTPNAEHDRTVVMSYDKANRMISSQLDAVENFVLDGQGGYTAEIISPTATNIYDKVGNKIVEIDPNGNKTYFYYDANGQITARLDAEGYFVRMEYDAFGNMTREDIFLEKQSITESEALTLNTDTFVPVGDSRTTEHVYDLGNNAIKTVLPSSSLFVDGQEITARGEVDRTFDAFGNILTETNIHLAEENSPYYTVRAYDVAGRLTLEVLPSAVELLQTDDEYAIEHRKQLGIVNADGSGKQLSQLSDADHAQIQTIFSTHYQYDAAGNLREKDQGGRLTTFEYDLNNRMTHMHMPHYTKVDVDVNGNVITTENYRIVASMSYDANDNIVSETRVDGTRLRHQYDRANRKTASIEENGTYTE